jgi:16S rRNA (cytidine1402-2'-O)-methyltransferase
MNSQKTTGTLYLCATPIGNLEDMTYRVVRILSEVDLIAAEDTRNSMKLLTHFDIHTPMTSYHEFNKFDKAVELVGILRSGKDIALITDAGTPGISDPGEVLVKMCIEENITVTSLPGACAAVTALTMSGQPTRRFAFEAFIPGEKRERKRILENLKNETRTIVIYEAPHHLVKTLKDLYETLGNRSISLCRELTKKHEENMKTTLENVLNYYSDHEPRGEYVLVIEGRSFEDLESEKQKSYSDLSIKEHVEYYESQGLDRKEAMRAAAKDRGISKRDVYNELLEEGQ